MKLSFLELELEFGDWSIISRLKFKKLDFGDIYLRSNCQNNRSKERAYKEATWSIDLEEFDREMNDFIL